MGKSPGRLQSTRTVDEPTDEFRRCHPLAWPNLHAVGLVESPRDVGREYASTQIRITKGRHDYIAGKALVLRQFSEMLGRNIGLISVEKLTHSDVLKTYNADAVVAVMRGLQVRPKRAVRELERQG